MTARDAVLYDNDLLMGILLQLPFKSGEHWLAHRQDPVWMYAQVAATCHTFNDVLRGKQEGLRINAQFILRRLLMHSKSPSSQSMGVIVRPRICAALGVSIARANVIPVENGRRPYREGEVGGMYVMPAAFDYVMEAEGGWAGLLKRFQAKVKAKVGAEERKARSLELLQDARFAAFKAAYEALGGSCTGAVDDPETWRKIAALKTAVDEVRQVKNLRLEHASHRGGGRCADLMKQLGSWE